MKVTAVQRYKVLRGFVNSSWSDIYRKLRLVEKELIADGELEILELRHTLEGDAYRIRITDAGRSAFGKGAK
jgi:hypothetical protein